MIISLIAAIGRNNELGKNNQLLWQMPADMKHFREITSGHPIIMGRKTFESIGRPLPNRQNIVITRDQNYLSHGVDVVHSLDEALRLTSALNGKRFEETQDEIEVFIIGGGQIYKEAISRANRLYITRVDVASEGADTFFPEIDPSVWIEASRIENSADEKNPFPYAFLTYEKSIR